jgi:hypothetical protein
MIVTSSIINVFSFAVSLDPPCRHVASSIVVSHPFFLAVVVTMDGGWATPALVEVPGNKDSPWLSCYLQISNSALYVFFFAYECFSIDDLNKILLAYLLFPPVPLVPPKAYCTRLLNL